jgi:hypothetical protein
MYPYVPVAFYRDENPIDRMSVQCRNENVTKSNLYNTILSLALLALSKPHQHRSVAAVAGSTFYSKNESWLRCMQFGEGHESKRFSNDMRGYHFSSN